MKAIFQRPILRSLLWATIVMLVASGCFLKPNKSEVDISMPDGIKLSTDVFIPKGNGPFPTLLVRTPYNKGIESWVGDAFGLKGIAVVIQDVRGKFKSEGEYYPFVNEREDGLQTVRWIKEQSWSNGIVAGWGTSYAGYTQWAVSDSLDFMVPLLTGANLYEFMYPDEMFSLQTAFNWGLVNAAPKSNDIPAEVLKESYGILPLSVADDSTIRDITFINDWLAHESYDPYWEQMDHRGMAKGPVLSIAGWYDIFLKTQIEDFQALASKGHPKNKLVIGPFCHGAQGVENKYGGEKKTGKPMKIFFYTANTIKGKNKKLPSPLKEKKYNLFIMERNEYYGADTWPPRDTQITTWYIGEDHHFGPQQPISGGTLTYKYNPLDPFPNLGGTALGDGVGPALQNDNIHRADQLSFETAPLEQPMILLGPISATLWLYSTAPCTDFIICLQDVFPDGKIINIQEGGAKVQFEDDKPIQQEISVWATGYQLNPNHKLRVVISSSWFPRFNRNLNDCTPIAEAVHPVEADQNVYFGAERPSAIHLPILNIND